MNFTLFAFDSCAIRVNDSDNMTYNPFETCLITGPGRRGGQGQRFLCRVHSSRCEETSRSRDQLLRQGQYLTLRALIDWTECYYQANRHFSWPKHPKS